MAFRIGVSIMLLMGSAAGPLAVSKAGTNTWTGTVNQDWFNNNNWSLASVPGGGDAVIVNVGAVTNILLTNSTAWLASFTITNNILVFSNWDTTLNATNVLISSKGILTLPGVFTNGVMSNRVHIVCSNLTLLAGSLINANSNGYFTGEGTGKGAGTTYGTGGGYGGQGGVNVAPNTTANAPGGPYGSLEAPVDLGSGGGGTRTPLQGFGGGAVRIEAAGTVSNNGSITANGMKGSASDTTGGGSGGSIFITCQTFLGGAQGGLQANGGAIGGANGGGGGGGRLALIYTNASVANGFSISAAPGSGKFGTSPDYGHVDFEAGRGTLYLSDTSLLSATLSGNLFSNVDLTISGVSQWTVNQLTVSNCSLFLAQDGFGLTVLGNVVIATNGHLGLGKFSGASNASLVCGGNLVLTNGGRLYVYSGTTNGTARDYGALVSVTGDVRVSAGSWVYPFAHTNDGSAVKFTMSNLWVVGTTTNQEGFNATAKGFGRLKGPGTNPTRVDGNYCGGAGYGGIGGNGYASYAGNPYGVTNAPLLPGSGCNSSQGGGSGGGLIWIEAQHTVNINGVLNANGADGYSTYGGAGSGGAIFISCATFQGNTNGQLFAQGGNSGSLTYSGGGGGGRIAAWHGRSIPDSIRSALEAGHVPNHMVVTSNLADFAGTISVTGGSGFNTHSVSPPPTTATPGTAVFLEYPMPKGTILNIL